MCISRDVTFHDSNFPFPSKSNSPSPLSESTPISIQSTISFQSPQPMSSKAQPVSSNTSTQPVPSNTPTPPQSPSSSITPSYPPTAPTTSHELPENIDTHWLSSPTRLHQMVTRAHNQISKPKIYNDGTVCYPLARALLSMIEATLIEPTCFTKAVQIPE